MIKNKTIALVDFDSFYYSCSKDTLEESLSLLDKRFESLLKEVGADYYIAVNSYSPYFRHSIDREYKSGRKKYESPLKWLKTLRSYSQEKYNVYSEKNVEADDIVAFLNCNVVHNQFSSSTPLEFVTKNYAIEAAGSSSTFEDVETIICSADKDVINLNGKSFDVKKWIFVETIQEEEDLIFWTSMISGDSADSIKGIPGRGQAFAKKLFLGVENDATALRGLVFQEYCDYFDDYLGVIEFEKNYRLLKMLDTWDSYKYNDLDVPQVRNVMSVSEVFNTNNKIKEIEF